MNVFRKINKKNIFSNYVWDKRGQNCFVCVGFAAVSRPGARKPWVVMVPRAADENGLSPWALMADNAGIRNFSSAEDAIKEAEAYLDVFNEYHRSYSGDYIDLSCKNFRISGAAK
nr:hypothetical protein [uncultured Acidocella sp.]